MSAKTLSFFEKSKDIFSNIVLLYKNFIHWNISKCCIIIVSLLLGIVLCLPFLIILIIVMIIDPISWIDILLYVGTNNAVSFEILSGLIEYPFYVLLVTLIFGVGGIMFLVGAMYGLVLETNLYLSYIRGKKIPYLSNHYFNIPLIKQYIYVFFRGALYLMIPVGIFLLSCIILYFVYFAELLSFDMLSLLSFGIFLFTITMFIYFAYRISFMYMIMLDDGDVPSKKSSKEILRESLYLTRGKVVIPFMAFVFILGIVLSPYIMIGDAIKSKGQESTAYLLYKSGRITIETEEAQADFNMLQDHFSGKTDDEVFQSIVNLGRINKVYILIGFLFLGWGIPYFFKGIFQMMLVSFYIHFLSANRKNTGVLGGVKNVLEKGKKMMKKVTKEAKPKKKTPKKKVVKKKTSKKEL